MRWMPLVLLCFVASISASELTVSDAAALKKAVKALQPGDTLILKDGTWKDTEIKLDAEGTQEKPITLRAQTPGKVILSGKSTLRIGGHWITINGLLFADGGPGGGC